jgi:hypothetical protein
MNFLSIKERQKLREQWPEGTRIKLIHMNDPHPVPDNMTGTVKFVDDAGTIHVNWDNGRTLGVVIPHDQIIKI